MKITTFLVLAFALISGFANSGSAQTKPRRPKKAPVKTAAKTVIKEEAAPPVEELDKTLIKKNERPAEEKSETENTNLPESKKGGENVKNNQRPNQTGENAKNAPVYFYTFAQPDFLVSKIFIEHDENGKGKISFEKKNFGDLITDPIQLSPATLERVKTILTTLDFFNSKDAYQSTERNYAHLGTMSFAEKKDGRERRAEFNWTENKDAKLLADEYRRIGQQFVWMFDVNVARQNQPLETPALMDALDSLIRRNEIADAEQMLLFLKELGNDERLPLIARNHAARLVKSIEKIKK